MTMTYKNQNWNFTVMLSALFLPLPPITNNQIVSTASGQVLFILNAPTLITQLPLAVYYDKVQKLWQKRLWIV